MQIGQAESELGREILINGFDEPILQLYYKLMVDMAVIFGANCTQAEEELKESLEFEMKLAKVSFLIILINLCIPQL